MQCLSFLRNFQDNNGFVYSSFALELSLSNMSLHRLLINTNNILSLDSLVSSLLVSLVDLLRSILKRFLKPKMLANLQLISGSSKSDLLSVKYFLQLSVCTSKTIRKFRTRESFMDIIILLSLLLSLRLLEECLWD